MKQPSPRNRPMLTVAGSLLIRLMRQYSEMAYRLTLLEIQKLAYLLQESGEPLRLRYVAHLYGPYAHNLNKALENLEGHFIRGYGDEAKPDVEIERLERVASVIDGFETPYGMELLASVPWVAVHEASKAGDAEQAVEAIQRWNKRKRSMFEPKHIRLAWARLQDRGWVTSEAGA